MSRIKEFSFGLISTLSLHGRLWSSIELIHFCRYSNAHSHELKEIAICASGFGWVSIDGAKKRLEPGDLIEIPSNASHFYIPETGEVLAMVIFHEKGQKK